MRVIYALGAKFAGSGIGTIAYHAVRAVHQHALLDRVFCSNYRPTEIPAERIRTMGLVDGGMRKLATFDRSGWVAYLQGVCFDIWVARQLESADLLHIWTTYGLRSLQRARELGIRTLVERASSHPRYQARLMDEEYRRWGLPTMATDVIATRSGAEIDLADYTLIPSDFVYESFLHQGVDPSRLITIPFGVDLDRFQPASEPGPHPFRVLFMGNVGLRKGVPYLLEAWRQLGWHDAELWLVGRITQGMRPILARYADLHGVRYIGHTEDTVACYQSADLFAFPTIEEGSALVTYEALACGLPVVTTPHAGAVLRDGREGMLTPIRDVDALATAIEKLRSNERLRRDMGVAARQRAEEFSWNRYGTRLVEAYHGIA